MGAERKLLLLLVQFRDYVDLAAERLGPDEFSDPTLRAVYEVLIADPELAHPPEGMEPSAAVKLESLLASSERLSEANRVFEDAIGQIKEGQLAIRAENLREAMAREIDPERQESLVKELEEVARLRRELKTDWRPAIRRRHDPFEPTP